MTRVGTAQERHPVRTVRTMCPMNCHPTLCGMQVDVRDGELLAVRGDPHNPDSRGFLCVRGQASREIIGNPARLLQPLLRSKRSDDFHPVGWDQALEHIVGHMQRHPPSATAWWPGHGTFSTNYGTRLSAQLMARLANFHGSQFWSPSSICWGLGAFGLGLTGVLETHTPDDLAAHAQLVLLWGANLASQPNTARHLLAAKARGAQVVAIDVRHTEASAKADETLLIRPGTDAALALALMHVICAEGLHDTRFVDRHTLGYAELAVHVQAFSPAWAQAQTGLAAERIVALARRYALTRPAMIVLGGSSMHKGGNGWQAARAVACLPALTGQLGIPGGGLGPRHGGAAHGRGLGDISAPERRSPPATGAAPRVPNQMSAISAALQAGQIQTLMLMGTNMLSSFADSHAVAAGLARTGLVVSFDLFLNDTARRCADVVLPATAWLEELGCKATATHLYLIEPALPAPGQTRSAWQLLTALAQRLGLDGFDPWGSEAGMIDAVLDHPSTGHATVASLRAAGGIGALKVSPVAHPDRLFSTPSGRVEFVSERARALGLPALPVFAPLPAEAAADHRSDMDAAADPCEGSRWRADEGAGAGADSSSDAAVTLRWPLTLTQGRTLLHFHSFYDNGRALPSLARRETEPRLWIAPADAAARGLADGAALRVFNARGELRARARVTDKIPPGTLWLRDGWPGLNSLSAGVPVLPDAAVDLFGFSAGQASFEMHVQVAADNTPVTAEVDAAVDEGANGSG